MNKVNQKFSVHVRTTDGVCPIGEVTGKNNMAAGRIPVLSCEGACIRGEIARLAANAVSKQAGFGRGCHGEMITVPNSAIARWINQAEKVVLIDGCFLRCHGRVMENMVKKEKLIQFDALSHYKKYTDIFDVDDVPERERKETAQSVANWVLNSINGQSRDQRSNTCATMSASAGGCCG